MLLDRVNVIIFNADSNVMEENLVFQEFFAPH